MALPKKDRRDLGTQTRSPAMQRALGALVEKREPLEQIIVHHYTDRPDGKLQLEVEHRSDTLGIHFQRVIL